MHTRSPSDEGSPASYETTVGGEGNPDLEAMNTEAESLDRGAHLGRYTVLERIGAGGMGVVYGAFDPQLDRKVALKVMHPSIRGQTGDSSGRSRLLREAQAMAKLSHPNVITVHDVGTFGDRVFVAMEFIDGSTLREWLRQQHRDWPEIVDAFVKAGRGLAAAHAAGLVHRDFKPDNVLIGREGRVLVMDFGLARTAGAAEPQVTGDPIRDLREPRDVVLTRTGALLGTPAYMAPEQHRGSKPDPHADQFSFCVALYEALYGERPFEGNSVTSLAMNVLDGQLRTPPKNSGVPTWLREVVARGLSTLPDDRWPSIDALLAELQRDPVDKRPPWVATGVAVGVGGLITTVYLVSREPVDDRCAAAAQSVASVWGKDARATVAAALTQTGLAHADGVALSVDAALQSWTEQWESRYLDICRANVGPAPRGPAPEEVPGLVCLGVAKTEVNALVHVLETSDPTTVANAALALETLPALADCIDGADLVATDLNPTPRQLQLRRHLATANALRALGHPTAALLRADGLASSAQALQDTGLEAWVLLSRARSHRALAELDEAETELESAVVLASEAGQPRLEATIWIELADLVGHAMDRRAEGLRLALGADAALARAGHPPRLLADLFATRGAIAAAGGRYDEAADDFQRALSTLERAGASGGTVVAALLGALGQANEGLGRFETAIEAHSRSLEEHERVLGSQDPRVGRALGLLGSAMLGADYLRKADASFVRARWVLDTPPGDSSADGEAITDQIQRDLADVEDRAGLLHRAREEFEQAEAAHRRSIALYEGRLPPEHRALGYPLTNLGLALSDQGRHNEALTPLRRAVTIWRATLPRFHPDLAVAHLNVGNAMWALGMFVEASFEYEQALDIWEHSLPPDHPLLAYALTGIGRCALAQLDFTVAIDRLERALAIRDSEKEDKLNLAETALALGQALWGESRDPTRARQLAERARDLVGAYEPSDPAGVDRLLDGEVVPRLTDQLIPAGLGTTNCNPGAPR